MTSSVRLLVVLGLVSVAAFACASGDGSDASSQRDAVSHEDGELTGFDPNNVVSDADFTNTSALTTEQIQAFLSDPSCYCGFKGAGSALATYSSNGKTAAQAIHDSAVANGISPVEFLARVQVERSMLCKPPTQHALDFAFSYGCPDNHPQCYDQWKGFDVQVQAAGKGFAGYLSSIKSTGTAYGWGPGKAHQSLDPMTVTPANAATAALYAYTPWVGQGNLGNSLHWLVWKKLTKCLGLAPAVPVLAGKPAPKPTTSCPAEPACTKDVECNHGAQHTGLVCANAGAEKGTCIDSCHDDTDCAEGETCDVTASPHFKCSGNVPAIGATCKTDADCKGGETVSRVCSTASGTCIAGCHSDADCGAGNASTKAVCDKSQLTWVCVSRKEIGDPCASDLECDGGVHGTQRVCNAGACDDACHTDQDCDSESVCSHATTPWACTFQGHKHDPNGCKSPAASGCPAVTFPSGVKIQQKTDAELELSYANHLKPGQTAPHCFFDVDDLKNPDTNEKYDYEHVMVSDHFSFKELTHTELAYGHRVLLDADAVASLEKFRDAMGIPVTVTSGYRSPKHQEAICEGYCGAIQCCIQPGNFFGSCAGGGSVSCSRYSRHMYGRAFDLPSSYLSIAHEKLAEQSGFSFAFNEVNHLHVGDD
jgi:hypothetical protein